MTDLRARLDALARVPVLLVAADYDGTLAPIVPHPSMAEPDPRSIAAMQSLAGFDGTHVAVISGRSLADLSQQLGGASWALLVGSHGAEFAHAGHTALTSERVLLLRQVAMIARTLAMRTPGTFLEEKPAGVAFHYRNATAAEGDIAMNELLTAAQTLRGLWVRHGKKVVELSVLRSDKGEALRRLRHDLAASAILFIGDDATDEDAFLALDANDVGIKVGPGKTAAQFRVDGTSEVASLLDALARRRGGGAMASHMRDVQRSDRCL